MATIETGEPVAGINTYFGLGSAATPATVVDISDFLTSVEPSEDTDELDATTFRRTSKNMKAGFSTISYTLNGYHSPESHAFFAPLRKMEGVAFEYGPEGDDAGATKISGTCTVFSYADPSASVDGISTFSVELRITTRTETTFASSGGGAAAEAKASRGIPRRKGKRAA